jgi:hypothetical protein
MPLQLDQVMITINRWAHDIGFLSRGVTLLAEYVHLVLGRIILTLKNPSPEAWGDPRTELQCFQDSLKLDQLNGWPPPSHEETKPFDRSACWRRAPFLQRRVFDSALSVAVSALLGGYCPSFSPGVRI